MATKAQREANKRWQKENYEDMRIRVRRGERDKYKALADKLGLSLNQLVVSLLEAKAAEQLK